MPGDLTLSPLEEERLAALARIKRIALGALALCLVVFVAARMAYDIHPAFGFLAAFAEAAAIGGLADWYAVVVLFRHPFGLKLPHTAIIPANQDRIGDNLGSFLRDNFLDEATVKRELKQIDFAYHVSQWLGDPERAQALSAFAVRLVPDVLDAIEETGFRDFAAHEITRQMQRTEVAPFATRLIDSFAHDGRYQGLLDEVFDALQKVMQDEAFLATIQKQVGRDLPTVLYVLQADSVIVKRIVKSAGALLDEIRKDPDHPLRDEFSDLFISYVERMKTSESFARRVERLKQDILARPELVSIADDAWDGLRRYVMRDQDKLGRELGTMLQGLARMLAREERLAGDINRGLRRVISALVTENRQAVSTFVSEQVKGWDFKQLVTLIEANVGRDLQFIRFNGMIVGGIAGLLLHAFDVAILP